MAASVRFKPLPRRIDAVHTGPSQDTIPGMIRPHFERASLARASQVGLLGLSLGLSSCIYDIADEGTEDDVGDGDGEGDTGDSCEFGNPAPSTEVEGCAEIVGEAFCKDEVAHVSTDTMIEWSNNPPHSGAHFPIWENKGEHDTAVERGFWVHNLEHGWIVLVYNCPEGCETELDVLRSVIDARPDLSILLTPDPLLDGPRFAALSWTWVHEFDEPVLDELLCFVDQHWDHAPESVP